MKSALTFSAAALLLAALAACGPDQTPSEDAPSLAVSVEDDAAPTAEAPENPAVSADTAAAVAASAAASPTATPVNLIKGSLCEAEEQVVWTCQAGARTISICASTNLNPKEGYAQYRIGRPGALEMEYPTTRVHPRGRFTYTLYPQGNSTLGFSNGAYKYSVFEDLRSSEDGVYVERGDDLISNIRCNGGTGFDVVAEAMGQNGLER
jgi:hypothetical protein